MECASEISETWKGEYVPTSSCPIGPGLPQEVLTLPLCAGVRMADQASPWDSCNWGRKALGEKIRATQYSWDQVLLAYTWVQLVAIAKTREKWWSKRIWEGKMHICLIHKPLYSLILSKYQYQDILICQIIFTSSVTKFGYPPFSQMHRHVIEEGSIDHSLPNSHLNWWLFSKIKEHLQCARQGVTCFTFNISSNPQINLVLSG